MYDGRSFLMRPKSCFIVCAFLFLILGIGLFLSDSVYAHYPFPCTQEEKEKAEKIDQAREQRHQQSVDALIRFLEDENHRVKTAAFLSLIYLSPSGFNMDRAVPIAARLKGGERHRSSAYSIAAAEVFLILQSPALSNERKQDKMIELSSAENGALRRIAIEGLRAFGNQKCLSALAGRINDSFGDHDDSYDMRAVSRIAFEVWWKIKAANTNPDQHISTIIASLEAAQPFSSRWADAACGILEDLGDAAVPQLIEAYSGHPGNIKSWAARTLRKPDLRDQDKNRIRIIALRDLHSKDPNDRRMAAYLLERLYEKEDLDVFVELLKSHEDPQIRNFAVSRLGDLGGDKAITALKEVLAHRDEQEHIRILAARSLAALGEKDGHDLLLKSLGSLDTRVRNISLGAIQYLDQDQVCARMLQLLKAIETFDSDDKRQRTLFAYARADLFRYLDKMPVHKLQPAIPTLKSLLKYPEDSIARSSARLLKKLGVALQWKYNTGQRRGWFEVMPTDGAKQTDKASAATEKEAQVRLSLAARRAAEADLNVARVHSRTYWGIREHWPHDSQHALASFEKAVSAFRAVSNKYAGSDIDAQARIGLFKLFHLAEDEKQSDQIIETLLAEFGADRVSDAYFELGIDYLQRTHDPRRALAMLEKIPMPPAPDANDKSPKGLHNYELVRHTYVKVQQPMAECEIELGELEKAESRYNKLIELFPELKKSFQHSLVFKIRSVATRRVRDEAGAASSVSIQKRNQQAAVRWLEDFQRRQAEKE